MKKNLLMILILFISLFLITGCWDRIDIENKAYVLGIAIDKYPPFPQGQNTSTSESEKKEEQFEQMQLHEGDPRYAMTIQIPVIKKSASHNPSGAGGSKDSGATWEITQTGNSFISMSREIASRLDMITTYEHMQVIVISEDIAREGLAKVLDFFVRNYDMRRRTKIFISKGEAKSILDVSPRIKDYSSFYLAKISINEPINSRSPHNVDIGKILNHIYNYEDFIIPHVECTKDEIKSWGGAIFKKGKMLGWIPPINIEYINLILNNHYGGVIYVRDPHDKSKIITLEMIKSKTKITPIIDDKIPSFKIDITIKGNFAEDSSVGFSHRITEEYLKTSQLLFENTMKDECLQTIKMLQKDFKTDILGFNKLLKTQEPAYWKTIAKQWDDIFPEVNVEVNCNVIIKQIGNLR